MKIDYVNNSPNFGVKLNTISVLEATTMKIFYNDGITGFKEVAHALNDSPIKATGSKGYKYYAEKFGKMIVEKYPEIAQVTKEIKDIVAKHPNYKKRDLLPLIEPIVNKLEKEIDITL